MKKIALIMILLSSFCLQATIAPIIFAATALLHAGHARRSVGKPQAQVVQEIMQEILYPDVQKKPQSLPQKNFKIPSGSNIAIKLVQGDITKIEVGAIVNAANTGLRGGGGVDEAIHNAAGAELLKELEKKYPGGQVGGAYSTSSCALTTTQHIIHAIGPDCTKLEQNKNKEYLLTCAYKNSLQEADKLGVESIAFPFISSNIFAYKPKEECAQVALNSCVQYLEEHPTSTRLKSIFFVLFSDEDFKIFQEAAEKYEDIDETHA